MKRIQISPVTTATTLQRKEVFGMKSVTKSRRNQGKDTVGTVTPNRSAFRMRDLMVTAPNTARDTVMRPETDVLVGGESSSSSRTTCRRPTQVERRRN